MRYAMVVTAPGGVENFRRIDWELPQPGPGEVVLRQTAIGVTALVDGLWLELCLSAGQFAAEEADAIARRFLDAVTSPATSTVISKAR